jgi:hypothetical protein
MVREKGTLINFMMDGAISSKSINWLLRSGKVPIGRERSQLIDRSQLAKWGVLVEHGQPQNRPPNKLEIIGSKPKRTMTQSRTTVETRTKTALSLSSGGAPNV